MKNRSLSNAHHCMFAFPPVLKAADLNRSTTHKPTTQNPMTTETTKILPNHLLSLTQHLWIIPWNWGFADIHFCILQKFCSTTRNHHPSYEFQTTLFHIYEALSNSYPCKAWDTRHTTGILPTPHVFFHSLRTFGNEQRRLLNQFTVCVCLLEWFVPLCRCINTLLNL